MDHGFPRAGYLLLVVIITRIASGSSGDVQLGNGYNNNIKSATFMSPEFVLGPGSVANRNYYGVDFPTGHIGIKSLDAEVVDGFGNSIPLHETYVHHWILMRYHVMKGNADSSGTVVRNSGICQGITLRQYYGCGSETRRTPTQLPDPYAMEVGNPAEIPDGYEERWMLNVHTIDTRGVEDQLGCVECVCDLYNVTNDELADLGSDYKGGLYCCVDNTQCMLKKGFQGPKRIQHLRYTVRWVDWDGKEDIVPVKLFIFDVTDTGERKMGSTLQGLQAGCQVEYDVKPCTTNDWCIDVKRTHFTMPTTGYVIYGIAHQHTGGIGSTLYRNDGQVICNSVPIYGTGDEPGNEAGYIVGMTICYPEPGSLKLTAGEELILESNFTSTSSRGHVGVMGLFHIIIVDQAPPTISSLHNPVSYSMG